MKTLVFFLATSTALAQYSPSVSGSTLAAGEVNSKPAAQTGTGAPVGTCTAGKDFYTDTSVTPGRAYYCDQANHWSIIPESNEPTFLTTRILTNGGKSCPVFPDNAYWNVDVSSYPQDQINSSLIANYSSTGITVTNATWAAGVATWTVTSTAGLINVGQYGTTGIVSSGCPSGGDCGYNSNVATLNGTGNYYTMTVVNGTTLTAPCCGPTTSNPGTYTSGGLVLNGVVRLTPIPSMWLNYADNTTSVPSYTWGAGNVNGADAGNYPLLGTYTVEPYAYPPRHTVANGPWNGAGDAHVSVVNMD